MAVVWELPGRGEEHSAADTLGRAAAVDSHWDVPGENAAAGSIGRG
jgi:hypothetical protein